MHLLGDPLVLFDNGETLRESILHTAAKLFALNGYESVSVRQIAQSSGVGHRQIYSLFGSKQELLHAMLDSCSELLSLFYSALRQECERAVSFREILDNIFIELIDITNEFTYFALCAAHQLQFRNEKAQALYCRQFLMDGVDALQYALDQGVAKKLCPPFDTRATATLISSSVIVANDVRAGQLGDIRHGPDLTAWYTAQVNLILRMALGPGAEAAASTDG